MVRDVVFINLNHRPPGLLLVCNLGIPMMFESIAADATSLLRASGVTV